MIKMIRLNTKNAVNDKNILYSITWQNTILWFLNVAKIAKFY
jgi:hypothetical protein